MSLKPRGKEPKHKFPNAPVPIPEELQEGTTAIVLAKARLAEAEAQRIAELNSQKKLSIEEDNLRGLRKIKERQNKREANIHKKAAERAQAAPAPQDQQPKMTALYKLTLKEQRLAILHTKASVGGLSDEERGELQELESSLEGTGDFTNE